MELPIDAVDKASTALEQLLRSYPISLSASGSIGWGAGVNEIVQVVLGAALPSIRTEIGNQIRAKLDARTCNDNCSDTDWCSGMRVGFMAAEEIARGKSDG